MLPFKVVGFRILEYQTENSRRPYTEWLKDLDKVSAAIIRTHVARMELGHFGVHRYAGACVWELKIRYGPGYRVYYLRDEGRLVILLCGGDKGSQKRDIDRAKTYAADYGRRK
jgi:putative addiction module killer protein